MFSFSLQLLMQLAFWKV